MLKKVTALLLILSLLAACTSVALATNYSSEISSIMTSYTLNNYSCKSAP